MKKYSKKKLIPESFNDEINEAITAITYNPKNIIFGGSFTKKNFRDASDIDLSERFGDDDKQVAKALKEIVMKILKKPEYIILDIKCGIYPMYVGYFKNLGYIQNKKIVEFDYDKTLEDLKTHKMHIDSDVYNNLIKLCKPSISLSKYFELCEGIRKIITLRWTAQQVLEGYNGDISLVDSIPLFITKIDMAFIYSGYFTEISNVFSNKSAIKNGLTFPPITPDPKLFEYCIKYNLLEYIENGKNLKALKRVWSLASDANDLITLEKIYPIITSNLAILNKANSIIKTHISIIELYGNVYNREIKRQLNNLKPFLSFIYEFPFNEKHIDELLDNRVNLNLLNDLSDRFDKTINKRVLDFNFKIPKKYIL
jgi:hypothetical protein